MKVNSMINTKDAFANSIYGSAVSMISDKSDNCSMTSSLAAKRAYAATELAVKEANYKMLLEEESI